jgi:kinesin family protein 4/21/27
MGTGLEADQQLCSMSDNVGILPRSVHHLFNGIEMLREEAIQIGQTPPEFRVQAQFLELYNEEIIDLLEPTTRVNHYYFSVFFFFSRIENISGISDKRQPKFRCYGGLIER